MVEIAYDDEWASDKTHDDQFMHEGKWIKEEGELRRMIVHKEGENGGRRWEEMRKDEAIRCGGR